MSYGEYVLSTGAATARWEQAFGRYLFDTYFQSREAILDIGPGRCWFVRQAPDRIIGLELSAELVTAYSSHGLNLVEGSIYEIPFGPNSFDGVFSCWLFEHLDDPLRGLQEIARVLKPGGYVCLIVPSDRSLSHGFYDDYTHIRPYTEASLTQLVRASGLSQHRIRPLFLTKGTERLSTSLSEARLARLMGFNDRTLRRLHLANRRNLVLEAWL